MVRRYFILTISVFISLFSLGAEEMTEAELLKAIQERPARAAGGYCNYLPPSPLVDTKAPAGFTPFYVSHLGRHGSRYHGSESGFKRPLKVFEFMKDHVCLTEKGDTVYSYLLKMAERHIGNGGLLTSVGEAEHFGIGDRLSHRFPQIFKDKDRNIVYCSSTTSQRCIQSMASFATAVKGAFPSVLVDCNVGLANDFTTWSLLPEVDKRVKKELVKSAAADAMKLQMAKLNLDGLADRLFTDRKKLEKITGNVNRFLYDLYMVSADAFCMGYEKSPYDFFTAEELLACWKVYNIHHANYGPFAPVIDIRRQDASGFARQLVEEADEAICGNGRCADLRFAHDGNIGPFIALLAVEKWDKPLMEDIHLHWQSWRNLCMGSNVQLIFYRNRAGEVLVKILRNEIETRIPALQAVCGPYYKWSDLRTHILKRAGVHRELPSMYNSLVETKTAQIKALQAKESDGFYFITDMHFPENAGNSAALIETLQNRCAPRKVIFGGDLIGTVHKIDEGKAPAEAAFQQMSAGHAIYLLRGNHDLVNRTSKGDWEKKPASAYTTARFTRFFNFPGAVYDEHNDCGCYYYFDNPSARIRYAVFDTSDMGPQQDKWMNGRAIGGLPKGWKLIVLSHKPLYASPSEVGNVMMMLCGHRHSDLTMTSSSALQVLTGADSASPGIGARAFKGDMPYSKKPGTVTEQAFDYISISKDKSLITMVRMGCGYDRVFHLKTAGMARGSLKSFESLCPGAMKWICYDSEDADIKTDDDGRYLDAKSTVLDNMGQASFKAKTAGIAIVCAIMPDGTRVFQRVKVK